MAVHHLRVDELVWDDAMLDRLTATTRLKAMILEGRRPHDIFDAWQAEVEAFPTRSAPYRLYD